MGNVYVPLESSKFFPIQQRKIFTEKPLNMHTRLLINPWLIVYACLVDSPLGNGYGAIVDILREYEYENNLRGLTCLHFCPW